MKFYGRFPSTDPVSQRHYKSKYLYSTFWPSVLFYSSIRVTALRAITTKNETHSCMMNDWSMIRQKLISAMDPPDSTRAKEMKQSDIKSTWHLSLFWWTNGSLWLLMFDTFLVWFGCRVAAFRLSGVTTGVSVARTVCGWTPTSALDHVNHRARSESILWESLPVSHTYLSVSRAVFVQVVKIFSVNDAAFSSLLLSMCQRATASQLFARSDSVCRGQVFQLCLLILSRGPDIWVLSDSASGQFPGFLLTPIS